MPWKERTAMSLRIEFIYLAKRENANVSELCRRFGISRKTGYKWLKRFQEEGENGLSDRSRRPHHSPRRSPAEMEAAVMVVRREHSGMGWAENQSLPGTERSGSPAQSEHDHRDPAAE